jgi:hypothetical protein
MTDVRSLNVHRVCAANSTAGVLLCGCCCNGTGGMQNVTATCSSPMGHPPYVQPQVGGHCQIQKLPPCVFFLSTAAGHLAGGHAEQRASSGAGQDPLPTRPHDRGPMRLVSLHACDAGQSTGRLLERNNCCYRRCMMYDHVCRSAS